MANIERSNVFLTGAAGGIGACFVKALLDRGVRRIYAADLAVERIRVPNEDDRVTLIELDITDEDAVFGAAKKAGDANILINNAGVNLRSPFLAAPTMASARREMEVNFFGTLAMCRAFAPLLRSQAAQGAAIINMLSILAKITLPNLGSYCATKAALLRLTEGVRAELAPEGVQVLAAMPWAVDTVMSGLFPGKKTPPDVVANGVLDAVERGDEDIYFHSFSEEINTALRTDPKGLEHSLAGQFRQAK